MFASQFELNEQTEIKAQCKRWHKQFLS